MSSQVNFDKDTRQTSNSRGSVIVTNPAGPYPIASNAATYFGVPAGRKPASNLDVANVFRSGPRQRGGKRRKTKKTNNRQSKSRKHHRKSSRR